MCILIIVVINFFLLIIKLNYLKKLFCEKYFWIFNSIINILRKISQFYS